MLVSGLTFGDYLLWSWSLSGNHDALVLVSGLTLPPLALICAAMLVLAIARAIASFAVRPRTVLRSLGSRGRGRASERGPTTTVAASEQALASTGPSDAPPRKLAA